MTTPTPTERDLVLTRDVPLSAAQLYRGWTEPELLKKWFAPKPWTTVSAELDVRPGGSSLVVMRSPEGQDFPNPGVYLEVVPDRLLVFTSAYTRAWEPAVIDPGDHCSFMMTFILSFEDLGDGRARYTACIRHWSVEDCKRHEAMGFYDGWGQCLDQLVALMS